MSNQFKALILNQDGENFSREVKSVDKSFLKEADVTVKVLYSGLNYKDALILKNGARLVKEFPHIPGIDFSGVVEESSNKNFKSGDEVILTGWRVGEIYFGGYSQYAKVNGDFLVKKPKTLSLKESMIMGTAGFTALQCSFTTKTTREELLLGEKVKDVLVTGATGGVGSVAVMVLSKMGYTVHAVTGKKDKSDYLKDLGAQNIIDRKEFVGESKLLEKGVWDGVVDTVGGEALTKILAQTNPNGIVAACGNAGGIKISTNVMPFIIRGVKLWGIDSSATSAKRKEFVWKEAVKLVDFKKIEGLTNELSLEDLLKTFPNMLKGQTFGRCIINPNK